MRLGFFTATEAAAVGIIYTLLLAVAFYKWRNIQGLKRMLSSTGRLSAAIMFMIVMASSLIFALDMLGTGPLVAKFLISVTHNPTVFLLTVVVVFLFLGCFIEGLPLVLIFVPLLMPTVRAYGIDTIHFGVLFTYLSMVAMLTPPVGATMYLVCRIAETDIIGYTREAWIFLGTLGLVGILLVLFPPVITFLPNIIMGTS
jgi:TRAP-type C4-dicarboxylate transport system permease large subunit